MRINSRQILIKSDSLYHYYERTVSCLRLLKIASTRDDEQHYHKHFHATLSFQEKSAHALKLMQKLKDLKSQPIVICRFILIFLSE